MRIWKHISENQTQNVWFLSNARNANIKQLSPHATKFSGQKLGEFHCVRHGYSHQDYSCGQEYICITFLYVYPRIHYLC